MDFKVDAIIQRILSYTSGDLVALSEIDDDLQELNNKVQQTSVAPQVLELLKILTTCISIAMKGGADAEAARIVPGFELLERFLSTTDPVETGKLTKESESFLDWLKETKKQDTPVLSEAKVDKEKETLEFFAGLLTTFTVDAKERLSRAQTIILEIENDLGQSSAELLSELFRIFHTIKGECGMLKVASLGELTHSIEGLLSKIRDGELNFDEHIIEILLEGIDHASAMLAELASGKMVLFGATTLDSFVGRIQDIANAGRPALGEMLVEDGTLSETDRLRVLQRQKEGAYTRQFGELAVENEVISQRELDAALSRQGAERLSTSDTGLSKAAAVSPVAAPAHSDSGAQMIKVKADRVTFLVDMIGELMIELGQLDDGTSRLSPVKKIVKSLQQAAMKLRTDSAKVLFGTMRRTIRDLSKQLAKPVEVKLVGENLEIDRNLIEKLEEPLVHLVRNSMDHGLENPMERKALGKPETGHITLSALRKGSTIVVSIADDGKGLDREKILQKALQKSLIDPASSEALSDSDVFNLIFHNGFSTSETVSFVSGRGVGMDIVNSFVKANRGRIAISTKPGQGTRFDLIFPLNTAILDGMVVRCGEQIFVLPIAPIAETLRIPKSMRNTINGSGQIINLRGEALPIVNLREAIGMGTSTTEAEIGIIVDSGSKRRSVITVDSIIAKQEVVIKPLSSMLSGLRGISGATVLSGGRIGLVLDTDEVIAQGTV